MDRQEPTDPQPEIEPLQQALEILFLGMRSNDERRRINAATGLMNYYLAREIGNLIALAGGTAQDGSLRSEQG